MRLLGKWLFGKLQARRDAWERDRAQEIKEITIKGLEPEIQRLLDKHRNEKRCLEEKLKKVANDVRRVNSALGLRLTAAHLKCSHFLPL